MKQIKDLKKGDSIIVSYGKSDYVFVETVKLIETGEDGFKGSGRWYMIIHTNHESQTAGTEILQQKWPRHWPINIPLAGAATNTHSFVAGKDVNGQITVADDADT